MISYSLHHIIDTKTLRKHRDKIMQTRKTALLFFNRNKSTDLTSNHPPLPTELRHHILSLSQPGFIQNNLLGQRLDDGLSYSDATI